MLMSTLALACALAAELQSVDALPPGAKVIHTYAPPEDENTFHIDTHRIWDAAPHNAFTDLVRWNDAWYCTFREGDGHVGGDGKTRIITSIDGEKWESAALIAEEGIDLRDPKLSIMPDGRLMALMGGSVYREGNLVGMQPRVCFSRDGKEWTELKRIKMSMEWLWRVTWHEGIAYGVSYTVGVESGKSAVKLVKSSDGVIWEFVTDMQCDEHCNEATLRFLPDDTCVALMRRDGGDNQGWVGHSKAPYAQWTWKPVGVRIGGPEFIIRSDGSMLGAGRAHQEALAPELATALGVSPEPGDRTFLYHFNFEHFELGVVLPSGGDTSYPGMVEWNGEVWISYYSSHEEKTAIYLTRLRPAAK